MQKVISGQISINAGHRLYGFSPSSIWNAKKDGRTDLKKRGPECLLGDEAEKDIADWIVAGVRNRTPYTRAQTNRRVMAWVAAFGRADKFPWDESGPGEDWWKRFKTRHPMINDKTPQTFTCNRRSQETEEIFDGHFVKVGEVVKRLCRPCTGGRWLAVQRAHAQRADQVGRLRQRPG